MNRNFLIFATCAALVAALCVPAIAQDAAPDPMADVVIDAQPVAGDVYMLTGRGGNIGLYAGDDVTFIVDDQFAPLTERIVAAIAETTDRPLDYVLNTHWHYDHTGGNENLGKAGIVILAHDNVHRRMQAGQTIEAFNRVVPPAPQDALPTITFDNTLTLHADDETIRGIHVRHAHTDGDTLVYFENANVIHMGDTFFNGLYPFIDLSSGGSIDGIIAAGEKALTVGDAETKIIPGHGPLASKQDLKDYLAALKPIRASVAKLIADGKTLEEVVAAKPTAPFDATANRRGFLSPEQFTTTVFSSLSR
ncbi:MAG: MBL fold metallo-hydrolase [Pseudomonadota bacterium]